MSSSKQAPHLHAAAEQLSAKVREIEQQLMDLVSTSPVEFVMETRPRTALVQSAAFVLERRGGRWGVFVHEQPSSLLNQKDARQVAITPINEAPLVVRADFLERSPAFVDGVLGAVAGARMRVAPALEGAERALAALKARADASISFVAVVGTKGRAGVEAWLSAINKTVRLALRNRLGTNEFALSIQVDPEEPVGFFKHLVDCEQALGPIQLAAIGDEFKAELQTAISK